MYRKVIATLSLAALSASAQIFMRSASEAYVTNRVASATGELARVLLPQAATNGWETGAHLAWLTNETDAIALAALSTNRVTKLETADGARWIDATGGVWRLTTDWDIKLTFSGDFSAGSEGNEESPPAAEYTAMRGNFISVGNWTFSFEAFADDTYSVEYNNGVEQAFWSSVGDPTIICPLVSGIGSGVATFTYHEFIITNALPRLAFISDVHPTNGLLSAEDADTRYAISNRLSEVSYSGQYFSLSNRPVVLASNGIARASHAWGVGYGGWSGWTASNITLTASNAVLTGANGCWLETDGYVTGIVSVAQSGVGTNGYPASADISLSYDGQTWYPITALPAKAARTGGAKIRVTQGETPGIPGATAIWKLNSVVCDTWIDSSRASEVFPLHAVSVQVDIPSDSLDAANKAYVDAVGGRAQETADQAMRWWENPAQGDAYMEGHRIHLGGGWSILGEPGSFAALSNDGSVGLGVIGDSAQFSVQLANENILIARFDTAMMQITAWSGAVSNMWVTVATNGLPASPDSASAWVEYSGSLDSGVWARAPIQTAVLPTNAATFRISFANPRWGESTGFFRVMRQSGNLAALRTMVPLRAPSIMVSESNSVAVATAPGVFTLDSIAQAPAAIANHAQLYSVLGELWTMDGDGNATRLSTHDGPLWVARSVNVYTGWGTTVDMVTGERTRFRLTDLRSWDTDQKAIETAQNDAIQRWQETPAANRRTPKPFPYVAKPEPTWMREQRLATEDPYPISTVKSK